MLALLHNEARQRGVPSCVMTFEPHPRDFFAKLSHQPSLAPARIAGLRDKLAELQACGIAQCVVLPFNQALARLSPDDFVQRMLVHGLGVRYVLVGDDFCYGAKRAGDYASLSRSGLQHGFEVARMNSYEISEPASANKPSVTGVRVSSSAVRQALADGDMRQAALLLGLFLKPALAWAMLRTEVRAVEEALSGLPDGSLARGRERLRFLVSRDVADLSEGQVRESVIESLAENLNDSVVAPVFWFVVLGLPGALMYRFANTADAMWGYPGMYRGRNWQWAGKWAARADDVLSWLPARITALLLAMAAAGVSWRQLYRDAGGTPSPNSGWPMAAMALALGCSLSKPRGYVLNAPGRAVQAADTERAIHLAGRALWMGVAGLVLFTLVRMLKDLP
jgi:cobalamin biosynthesis protein CobD